MKLRVRPSIGTIAVGVLFICSGMSAGAAVDDLSKSDSPKSDKCPAIINIDVPNSIFDRATAINGDGAITGFWVGANHTIRSFLRESDGKLIVFDAPGAGGGRGFGTNALSINAQRDIAGYVRDASGVYHGFLREPDGTFVTFDAPGAGTDGASLQGTFAEDINPEGVIAGQYLDNANVSHGFVRDRDGIITTFDAPGAGIGPGQGTFTSGADGLSAQGWLSGGYQDAANVLHGYVRDPQGTITIVNAPEAGSGPFQGTNLAGINARKTVVGQYQDDASVYHGFLGTPNGVITNIDVSGAGTGENQGSIPQNINAGGDTTGNYVDANDVSHGFLRHGDGRLEIFDAPAAGGGPNQGTFPGFNNSENAIVGFYIDANNVFHAFLRTSSRE